MCVCVCVGIALEDGDFPWSLRVSFSLSVCERAYITLEPWQVCDQASVSVYEEVSLYTHTTHTHTHSRTHMICINIHMHTCIHADNEEHNCRTVSTLGVHCVYTPRGMTEVLRVCVRACMSVSA